MDSRESKDPSLDVTTAGSAAVGAVRAFAKVQGDSSMRPGQMLGRYEIAKTLGEGGMGAVYQARDTELDRMVALKVIKPELADVPSILQRFRQELILARQITHRNIVRIYDLGEADGVKFITMEYVDGEDLRTIMRRQGKLAAVDAALIVGQMLEGLVVAHQEGIVHRDLKPGNVMRDANGRVVIMDFGLAHSETGSGMTQTGEMLGTIEYMSPEQALGKTLDRRSDLFTVGLIFYELLTGKIPFEADSVVASLVKRSQERAVPVSQVESSVPSQISEIIAKCLETEPAKRYQDANEIIQDLNHWRSSPQSTFIPNRITIPHPTRLWPISIAAVFGIAFLAVAAWYLGRGPVPVAKQHAPVSVLVADFQNHTGDPIFDDTLEPMFNVALEGASFINAFNRGEARRLAKKLSQPSDKLDEQSARLIAVSQGINAVVTGEINRRGNEYDLEATALDGVTGNVLAKSELSAANKDDLMLDVAKLAATVRKALGDSTPQSAQIEATAGTFKAASLEAVHLYGVGMEQQFAGHMADALQSFSKAVELDPNFARAYVGMTAAAANLGRRHDASEYTKLALQHLDHMTERERYRFRGVYYLLVEEDWQKCIDEYTGLVHNYPADNLGHLNLAYCLNRAGNIPKAIQELQESLRIVPNSLLARSNMALFSLHAGNFEAGEQEARTAIKTNPAYEKSYRILAYSQFAQGRFDDAMQTYGQLEKLGSFGASLAFTGVADIALYQGRFSDAVRILETGLAAELKDKKLDPTSDFAALANVQLRRGHKPEALAALAKALEGDKTPKLRYWAARMYLQAGETAKAQKLAADLAGEAHSESQAYAKLIAGEIALQQKNLPESMQSFTEANKLADTWIGRFDLGRAYLEAGQFLEATSEFDRCIQRRGETLDMFDSPNYGFTPEVFYYQGRAREGLKSADAAESYRTYLKIRGNSTEDPLVSDVRHRLGQ